MEPLICAEGMARGFHARPREAVRTQARWAAGRNAHDEAILAGGISCRPSLPAKGGDKPTDALIRRGYSPRLGPAIAVLDLVVSYP